MRRLRGVLAASSLLVALFGCGSQDNGGVINGGPPISIDSPTNGFFTSAASITVQGSVNRPDGVFPAGIVSWSNGSSSGTTPVFCGLLCCLFVCVGSWQVDVPLHAGTNAITAVYMGASASATVMQGPTFLLSGSAVVQGTSSALPDVLITALPVPGPLSPPQQTALTDLSGTYALAVFAGNYTLGPQLSLFGPFSCLTFSPTSIAENVTTADVSGQGFSASQASSCYSINGRVTANTNPGLGVSGVAMTITASNGKTLRWFTDSSGAYSFHYFAPGTFTVAPSSCPSVGPCQAFVPASRSVTITNSDASGQDFVEQF